jgi:hypothetical protein
MTLTLREGNYYQTRGGHIVGPLMRNKPGIPPFIWTDGSLDGQWTKTGSRTSTFDAHPDDLVEKVSVIHEIYSADPTPRDVTPRAAVPADEIELRKWAYERAAIKCDPASVASSSHIFSYADAILAWVKTGKR